LKHQILTASVRAVKLAAEALKRPWDSLLQGNLLTRQEDFLCNAATSVKPPLIGYNPMPLTLRLRWWWFKMTTVALQASPQLFSFLGSHLRPTLSHAAPPRCAIDRPAKKALTEK
jgi:hypothetical protein